MSTTPRTDAECIQIYSDDVTGCSDARDYVDASFARQLETELAAAKAECNKVRVLREQLNEASAYFAVRELGDPAKLLLGKINVALAATKEDSP